MPIYKHNGTTFNIPDNEVQGFEAAFPDATLSYKSGDQSFDIPLDEREGFLAAFPDAQLSITTEQPDPMKEAVAASTSANVEPLRGFWANVKEGSKELWIGMKGLAGEAANLVTGTSRDERQALAEIERIEAMGENPSEYLSQLDMTTMPAPKNGKFYTEKEQADQREYIKQQERIKELYYEALEEAGGNLEKAKQILAKKAEEETSWGDKVIEQAMQEQSQIRQSKGFGGYVGRLVPQMLPNASAIALAALTRGRSANVTKWLMGTSRALGATNIVGLTASTAGSSMLTARQEGATNAEVWSVGMADAAIELITEWIPFDTYTKGIYSGVKSKVSKQLKQEVFDNAGSAGMKELEDLLVKANKKLGGKLLGGRNVAQWLGMAATEGASEAVAGALQTITPMIYENPEDYPTLSEILINGWEGAKAGLLMGAFLGGASKAVQHTQNRDRRKNQGYVNIAEVDFGNGDVDVVEVVGKDEETGNYIVLRGNNTEEVTADQIVTKQQYTFNEFESARLTQLQDEAIDNGTVTAGQTLAAENALINAKQELETIFDEMGYTDEQKAIAYEKLEAQAYPFAIEDAPANVVEAMDAYMHAASRNNDLQQSRSQSEADEMRVVEQAIVEQVGQEFWRQGEPDQVQEDGTVLANEPIVEIGTLPDGRVVYVLSEPNEIGEVAAVTENGEKIFVKADQFQGETTVTTLGEFLSARVNQQRLDAEQARMAEEAAPQLEELKAKYEIGVPVNLGTEDSPIEGVVIAKKAEGDGVLIETPSGVLPYTYEQLAEIEGAPIRVFTDEQIAAAEAAEIEAAHAARQNELAQSSVQVEQAEAEADEAATLAEIATETPLPLNPDGTVNEDALFKESPARWAQWNDEQAQDGGASSMEYIGGKLARAEQKLAELQAAYANEDSLNKKRGILNLINEQQAEVNDLAAVMQTYAPVIEEAVAEQEAQPVEIPTDKKGNKMYHLAPQQQTMSELLNDFSVEEVRGFAEANINSAKKELAKDKAPVASDFAFPGEYQRKKAEYEAKREDLAAKEAYWTNIANTIDAELAKETSFQAQPMATETEPRTAVEMAAYALGKGWIRLQRASVAAHTGYGNTELNKMIGLFAGQGKGGLTVEAAGEELVRIQNEMFDTRAIDENDPMAGANAILEALQTYATKGEMAKAVETNRMQEAQQEADYIAARVEQESGKTVEELAQEERAATEERLKGERKINIDEYDDLPPDNLYRSEPDGEADWLKASPQTMAKIYYERQIAIHNRISEWGSKLPGLEVIAIDNAEDVKNEAAKEKISRGNERVYGWYEQGTNKVFIYVPDFLVFREETAQKEIDKTIIHEGVSHKGLKEMLGEEGFNELCDHVWNEVMSDADKAKFLRYVEGEGPRAAADEYMAFIAEEKTYNTAWDKIAAFFKKLLAKIGIETKVDNKDFNSLLKQSYARYQMQPDHVSSEQLDAPNSGKPSQIVTAKGTVLADTNGKGATRFSRRTWKEGGRDYLVNWLGKDKVLTQVEKDDIVARMDEFYANSEKYTDTYVPFGSWSDAAVKYDSEGNPLMSVIKANGDYAMNLDFSLVCKKRRPLNRLLRNLINRNAFSSNNLSEREIAEINWILQEHGFEVACALCFVDSKRYRVTNVANVFAQTYNKLVKALAPKGAPIAHFNYNNNPNVEVVENGIDTYSDDQLNWDAFDKLAKKFKPTSVEGKVAKLLRKDPSQRKLVDATDFIEAEGFEAVKANNQELLTLYNSKKGTGGPKASFGDVQYLNDILKKDKSFDVEKAYSVGGVRIQSFSDFVPHMYFDYMQLFAELAAKRLPAHAYTKEVLFAKIFGLSGLKINLSLVPAVVDGGVAPGLDADGNYAWADAVKDTEGNVIQMAQSFPYDEAMAIQNAPGYSKNCGVIAVGISDEHIEKMLDDPNIPYIIPYHKSSLNAIVARMTNIEKYKDYTKVQNTRKANGSKLNKGTKDFNFNEYLHSLGETGSPQQAAQAYLDWCKENNYKPKFSQFAYHPNYYKLLQDFNTIDTTTGEYAPQGAVTMTFPTEQDTFGNVETLIQQGLQEDAEFEEKLANEIDVVADEVVNRLAEIAKEPKLSEKQQLKKMAKLADERMAQLKAKSEGVVDLVEEARKAQAKHEATTRMRKDEKQPIFNLKSRDRVPKVRGGWTEAKILRYLKENGSREGVRTASMAIAQFDSVDELKEHMFYHGSQYGAASLKPSITMSDRDVARYGGGGYGDKYWGVSVSSSKKSASRFSQGSSVKVYPIILLKDANVIERPDFTDAWDAGEHIIELWEQGVDAVWIGNGKQGGGEQELLILNPRAIVNINTPDFYQYYQLGSAANPLRIADDAKIEKMFETAKEYASTRQPHKPMRPMRPFEPLKFGEGFERKPEAQYLAEMEQYKKSLEEYERAMEEYERAMEEYNRSEAKLAFDELQRRAHNDIRFRVTSEQDKAYMDAVEAGDLETAQKIVDEAAEAAGYTIRGEHGRVSKFNIFDRDKANPEGNWGRGFYFTNNEEDVENNYATVDGPDLEAKMEREVERRINLAEMNEEFDEDGEVDEFAIREAVENEFITSEPNVVHAAIRMDNPFVVGHGMVEIGEDGLGHYDMEETYLTSEYETDEDGDVDFSVEPTGTLVDLVEALNEELSEYEGVNIDANEILWNNIDGMTAAQFEKEARELLRSREDYLQNDNLEIMTSEILRAAIERAGFDGIIDNTVNQKFGSARKFGLAMEGVDRNTRHYVAFQSSQIKQTDAVTYDDEGSVIPLSERFNSESEDIRFRKSNENQAIFVSNAAKAVEGIKMEKATPEQWLKMIEKNGGLKAGEDKWMGLSDWLKSSDKKTLTKEEVLAFVNENMIQIEETHYGEESFDEGRTILDEKYPGYGEAFSFDYDEDFDRSVAFVEDEEAAVELYNNNHNDKIEFDEDGNLSAEDTQKLEQFGAGLADIANGITTETKQIYGTRLNYTTRGLTNNHEIALTVPTIESWNENDITHFGDAGEGRAVAWIRFGETTDENGTKTLVIDEIQSKRHQEGREKGYKTKDYWPLRTAYLEKKTVYKSLYDEMAKKYGDEFADDPKEVLNPEDYERIIKAKVEFDAASDAYIPMRNAAPEAPFEKNWHELAMKRMLRYAAENGYDAIAWTKGGQQAERYGLSEVISSLEYGISRDGSTYYVYPKDKAGLQPSSIPTEFKSEKEIADIYGKEIAVKIHQDLSSVKEEAETLTVQINEAIQQLKEAEKENPQSERVSELTDKYLELANARDRVWMKDFVIEGEDLKVGGEGMRGFYDKMLPAFMNKYGKKWGIKVSDMQLPNLENGLTMHSIPVTEEMKESVMQGQTMFRLSAVNDKSSNVTNARGDLSNEAFVTDVRFRLNKSARQTISGWLDKRPGLSDAVKNNLLEYLDQFDDTSLQLAMGKWFVQNTVRLPEDAEKCMQAVASAKKAKVDPMRFSSPMEIINEYGVIKPKEKPINPDDVPTLTKVKELKGGFSIYDVEESEKSRENLRQIINTHYGKNCSPWCLLQGDESGRLTEKSAQHWSEYSAYPKQVVFKDGKLLAFSANNSSEVLWWDRMDKPTKGIPVAKKLDNNRNATSVINPKNGKEIGIVDIHSSETKNGVTIEKKWAHIDDKYPTVERIERGNLVARVQRYSRSGYSAIEYVMSGRPEGISSIIDDRSGKQYAFYPDGSIDRVQLNTNTVALREPKGKAWEIYHSSGRYAFNKKGKLIGFYDYKDGDIKGKDLVKIEIPEEVQAIVDSDPMSYMAEAEKLAAEIETFGEARFRSVEISKAIQEEMDAIKASAIVMGNFMKAPNGKETQLTEEQWLMARTKSFKDWFGDWINDPENASKVVDENGEPMVVYHGTGIGGFSSFAKADRGIYFTETRKAVEDYTEGKNQDVEEFFPFDKFKEGQLEVVNDWLANKATSRINQRLQVEEVNGEWRLYDNVAKDYHRNRYGEITSGKPQIIMYLLQEYERYQPEYRGKGIYPVFLNLKKPLIFDASGKDWASLPKTVEGITIKEEYLVVPKEEVSTDEWAEYLQSEEGREMADGMIVKNVYDSHTADGTITDYVAFDSSQIKSATNNNGEFSPEDPDIRFRKRMKDESAMEFYQATLDEFLASYNPVAEIKLFPVNEETAKLKGYTLKELEETSGEYDEESDLISIFVHEDEVYQTGIRSTIFHESIHKNEYFFGGFKKIGKWMLSMAENNGVFAEYKETVVNNYKESEHEEEMLCNMLGDIMAYGEAFQLLDIMPADIQGACEDLLNQIGYDRTTEKDEKVRRAMEEESDSSEAASAQRETSEGAWQNVEEEGGEPGEIKPDTRFRTSNTPTEEIVARGINLSKKDLANLAGEIFAIIPEDSREKITDSLDGNLLGLQDAILKLPVDLAMKENWTDEDVAIVDAIAEQMTNVVGKDMTRPFTGREALWTLYNAVNNSTDLVSEASRALVKRNLGFSQETLEKEAQAKEDARFRRVSDAGINATASLYNKGSRYVWTRLKESVVDMNASVEELVKAIETTTGKKAEGFENVLLALNQQASKGLAAMESYENHYLKPMFDEIVNIMKKGNVSYDDVVRYVILKHGLERNKKLAQRDAKAYYQEQYDEIIAKINSMNESQKRTYLTNAQLKNADAKAELARLKAVDQTNFTEEEKAAHKRELAKARKEVEEAKKHLVQAQKIRSMSEQEAQDELQKIFNAVENGADNMYKELRENDYSGISSMFYDQLGVNRKDYDTVEAYEAAVMAAKQDKYAKLSDVEAAALAEVASFENKASTEDLWKKINAATKETLRTQYQANLISKDQYENLRSMFEYYVPLRGFADNTAEDMYTYYRKPNTSGYTKPILGAEGRKTQAESPFGWIASMAGSAVASNVKNEAKLALYYFVSNRPENGIATISKTWFVDSGEVDSNGKKIFKPVYPPFVDDLSSDAAKASFEAWQENMQELKAKGQAYESGQRLNLGNAVVNIEAKNQPEHVVVVKVGGKDYTIVINGNPRAAQAINGDFNVETESTYQKIFGPMLRWMSSVNTSYNPEFWITNMMRDILFTTMAVNIKEDSAYKRKFRSNYLKAMKVIKMSYKNEKGTLGDSYLENMYKDFVANGGVTGYTQIKDSEEWEKEIEKYMTSNNSEEVLLGNAMKKTKNFLHAIHQFGEGLEQVSRFAAFLTARETGKSMAESINDAKEITVNFNRKGSGMRITLEEAAYLTDKNGQPLNKFEQYLVSGLSLMSAYGRRVLMFFNASMQGLNAAYKLWKKNKLKTAGWAMGYTAIGFMYAMIRGMVDDDDDYLDMPQYERWNSFMIGAKGVYFKWALPQEARAFYALGQLAAETALKRNPHQNAAKEAAMILGEVAPANLAEVALNPAKGWRELVPSILVPGVDLITNDDYLDMPIFNEQKWLSKEEQERTAKWSKAYQGTGKLYVEMAKVLNNISGGDEFDAGIINLPPEAIEHIVQSAFGGTIRTADKFVNTVTAAIDREEEVTVRQSPFLNRVLTLNDERFKNAYVNDVYNFYAAEALHALSLEKQYTEAKNTKALLDLRKSDEYKWARVYESYKDPIQNTQDALKVARTAAERDRLMSQQEELKKRMIKQISNMH